MDYLDELDDAAMQALTELTGHTELSTTSAPTITALPSKKVQRQRLIQSTYLLRLEGPLSTPRDVANSLSLTRVPQLEVGIGEADSMHFCRLSQSNINDLEAWAANCHIKKKFTKIRLNIAHKDLELPMLGRDPTLPQHRDSAATPLTCNREFPVAYFFYGTLASPSRLAQLFDFSLDEVSELKPATVYDGKLRTWAGKYRALVDCPGESVQGHVYTIRSAEQEDALRVYEGESYEVVRAKMIVDGKYVEGRTFRFSGFLDELFC